MTPNLLDGFGVLLLITALVFYSALDFDAKHKVSETESANSKKQLHKPNFVSENHALGNNGRDVNLAHPNPNNLSNQSLSDDEDDQANIDCFVDEPIESDSQWIEEDDYPVASSDNISRGLPNWRHIKSKVNKLKQGQLIVNCKKAGIAVKDMFGQKISMKQLRTEFYEYLVRCHREDNTHPDSIF